MDKKIEAFIQTLDRDYAFADKTKSVSYAHMGPYYFAYTDNFKWNNPSDKQNCFPGRDVYVLRKDGKIYRKWGSSLDLFGIPCD